MPTESEPITSKHNSHNTTVYAYISYFYHIALISSSGVSASITAGDIPRELSQKVQTAPPPNILDDLA